MESHTLILRFCVKSFYSYEKALKEMLSIYLPFYVLALFQV